MQGVVAAPLRNGCQRDDAGEPSNGVVESARREKRSVRAIVHDDERPHEEPGRWKGEHEPRDHRDENDAIDDSRRAARAAAMSSPVGTMRDHCCAARTA